MIRQVFVALVASALVACGASAAEEQRARRPFTAADAVAGKALYLSECSSCHGERGDGAGPAADFVDPRPRDFTKARFKLRTTKSGEPPATKDILQVIERGIPGTAMPSFSYVSEDEREKIAAYVLKLAGLLETPEPKPIVNTAGAPPTTPATIAKGKQLYANAGCAACHGVSGKGDGRSAKDLKDADGRPIKARDFTEALYRGGGERADVYTRMVTGMDGTPMPSYGDVIEGADIWVLADYVLSLRVPPVPKPRPADPIAAGREVAAKYSCGGCHVLDDGNGGDVGPDLRVAAQKLLPKWVRTFLKAPHDYGKIYPSRVYGMPRLALTDEEVEVITKYLATIGNHKGEAVKLPDVSKFPEAKVGEGKLIFTRRCTECHNLGTVIAIPEANWQGPDLIRVTRRVDYEWVKNWIRDPKHLDPNTTMSVPDVTPDQADAVRMFVWKTAVRAAKKAPAGRTHTPPRRDRPERQGRG